MTKLFETLSELALEANTDTEEGLNEQKESR